MSRVEDDREFERIELKRLAEKQVETRRVEGRAFSRVVADAGQAARRLGTQQQGAQQQRRNSAAQSLLARRGISNVDYASTMLRDGEGSLKRKRQDGGEADRRSALAEQQLDQAARLTAKLPVDAGEGAHPGRRDADSKDERAPKQQEGRREVAQASGQLPFTAVGGVMGRTSAAGGAAAVNDRLSKMLSSIVASARVGVMTSRFKREGFIQVTLKDSILHGAILNLRGDNGGVALGIHCADAGDSKLLADLGTGRALHQALAAKGIRLTRLDINNRQIRL